MRCSDAGGDLQLLDLSVGRQNIGVLRLRGLDDIRCGELNGKMDCLIYGLSVSRRYGHLDGDSLLHWKLDHLWNGGAYCDALTVGELDSLKVLEVLKVLKALEVLDIGGDYRVWCAHYLTGAEYLLMLLT